MREKLSETISQVKTVGGPAGHCVVVNATSSFLNGRTGTYDKNIAEALAVSADFDPNLVGGNSVITVGEAREMILEGLECELAAINQKLFPEIEKVRS